LLIYHGQAIPKGAIFLLEGGSDDHKLEREEAMVPVQSWARHTDIHDPTGWWFIDPRHLDDHTLRYEAADVTGLEAFMLSAPNAELTPAPDVVPKLDSAPPRPGRPPQHTKEEFHKTYEDLYDANGKKHPRNAQLSNALKVTDSSVKNYKKKYGLPVLPK